MEHESRNPGQVGTGGAETFSDLTTPATTSPRLSTPGNRESSRLTDWELVERVQTERDADRWFTELYRRYCRATHAYFLHRLGDPAWAEDLNQELHLRLSRAIKEFRGECSWKNFVFTVAWRVLAEARKQRWSRHVDLSVPIDEKNLLADLKLDSELEDQAELMLFRRRLRGCMQKLDEVARAVVIEHYFNDVNLTRLTEKLGLTNPSGARATLIGALRKLRRCLQRGRSQ